ncbi:helix-turn-helix domain-containing protein [Streptomyces sp. WZ-12]|uniref:helix-turn-helix domain-containing protein n=1 Tax=Streptomyces sp. WZ-12 TaxID=3030210 RepID=UPI0023810DEE|nr:MerR family transcriptional regulator [Streptomyces sp. WZ-12]
MTDALYSISQAARCFGLPVSTLRYYDELGVLPAAGRRGNVRYYGRRELRRLALVQRLHHRGLVSLADTAVLVSDGPADDQPSGREVLTASIAVIKDRIAHLQAAQGLLEHLLTCPKADPVRECAPLRAELDRDVAEGLAGLSGPDGRPSPRVAPPLRAPRPPR